MASTGKLRATQYMWFQVWILKMLYQLHVITVGLQILALDLSILNAAIAPVISNKLLNLFLNKPPHPLTKPNPISLFPSTSAQANTNAATSLQSCIASTSTIPQHTILFRGATGGREPGARAPSCISYFG